MMQRAAVYIASILAPPALALSALGLSAGGAMAQSSSAALKTQVTISPNTLAPDLGKIVSGTTATTFHVAAGTGAVSIVSGNAVRLTSGAVTSPQVSVLCQGGGCKNRSVSVTLSQGASTGGRTVTATAFNISGLSGGTVISGATSGPAPLTFTLAPMGTNGVATFHVGLDSLIPATGPSGQASWTYTVTAVGN